VHRVLVVEDDATLRAVIRLVLEREGYEIHEAEHGRAALDAMAGAMPDVAVVDLKMPVMDGGELIRRMRADSRLAAVPIVLLSGYGESVDGGQAADEVLAKPFEPRRLLECLRTLVARAG
jgi:CheY-like chemotaxis protein